MIDAPTISASIGWIGHSIIASAAMRGARSMPSCYPNAKRFDRVPVGSRKWLSVRI